MKLPNAELIAICDINNESLKYRGDQFKIPTHRRFHSLKAMLDSVDIDVVDIVTGPETHPELVHDAAEAGKHILCQKPFAISLELAIEMVKDVQSHGVRIMVTENWRRFKPFQIIHQLLHEDLVGPISSITYTHKDFYIPRMRPGLELPQPFLRTMPRLLFYEMGSHCFDTWRFLFGEPKELHAKLYRVSPYVQGEDAGVIHMDHDGFRGVMDMSWASRFYDNIRKRVPEVKAEWLEGLIIDGEHGAILMDPTGKSHKGNIVLLTEEKDEIIAVCKFDTMSAQTRLQKHFLQCLDTGEEFHTSAMSSFKRSI